MVSLNGNKKGVFRRKIKIKRVKIKLKIKKIKNKRGWGPTKRSCVNIIINLSAERIKNTSNCKKYEKIRRDMCLKKRKKFTYLLSLFLKN